MDMVQLAMPEQEGFIYEGICRFPTFTQDTILKYHSMPFFFVGLLFVTKHGLCTPTLTHSG